MYADGMSVLCKSQTRFKSIGGIRIANIKRVGDFSAERRKSKDYVQISQSNRGREAGAKIIVLLQSAGLDVRAVFPLGIPSKLQPTQAVRINTKAKARNATEPHQLPAHAAGLQKAC